MRNSFLTRIGRAAREEGVRGLMLKCLYDLGYKRFILLRRSLVEPIPNPANAPPLEVVWLEPEMIAEYRTLHPTADAAAVGSALSGGDRCLLARLDGEVVGAIWSTVRHGVWSSHLRLTADEVYVFESCTAQGHRGRGVAPTLLAKLMHVLHAEGRRSVVMLVFTANTPALKAYAKVGFRPEAMVTRIGIGPLRRDVVRYRTLVSGNE